jgi:flagellar hook-associated protein 1 FlgK
MGLFSILSVGTRGLFASTMGMDVAGQNISNADVEGYSRKRLTTTADYRYDSTFGQMGFGVDVVNIQRMRDGMIDEQIRRQNQQVGMYTAHDDTLQKIENVFSEPGANGLQTYIDNFFDSWQNVINNPADLSARTMVRTSAEIMNDVFHNVSGELTALKESLNENIAQSAKRANELLKEIANVNTEVGAVEMGDQKANDSRDRRDVLLKELSGLINVDTIENDQGQISVTSNGNMLVSPSGYRQIETTTQSFTLPDGTQFSNIGLRFADSKRAFVPTQGTIKGYYDSRDVIVPAYQAQIDTMATTLVTKVNELHQRGYSLNGYTGNAFFNSDTTGASDIALAPEIINDVQNIAAASGGAPIAATQAAIPAGQADFGTLPLPQLSKTLGRLWVVGDPANQEARNMVRGSVIVQAGATTLIEGVDYHIDYVNGTMQMLHGGYNGQALTVDFNYDTGQFAGPGDNSNALTIAQLRHQLTMSPDPLGNETNTFSQYYSAFIGQLGLQRNEATANLETRQYLVTQYESHQEAIAGVSLDEEMADIIKYQHTYTATARLISTASQMLDVLMSMAL